MQILSKFYCRACNDSRQHWWRPVHLVQGKRVYAYVCMACRHQYVMYNGEN